MGVGSINIRILSYSLPDNPPEAIDLQRKIFNKCGLEITQVTLPLPWPDSMNWVDNWIAAQSRENPDGGMIICHTDVIPLHRRAIQDVYFPAIKAGALIDFVCRPMSDYYYRDAVAHASGALMGFSARYWVSIGRPSMRENETNPPCWDIAGAFSRHAAEREQPVILLPPSDYAKPATWRLYDETLEWGPDCTYAGLFYHALEFRFRPARFINKAREVLKCL